MELTSSELSRIDREVDRYDDVVQAHYHTMVANGQNPRFALMCATQVSPGTRYTNKTFCSERLQVMKEMKPKMREKYLQQAKKAGINPHGQLYVGALGRPTDPHAWVSTVDDAKQVCQKKNLTADGIVRHKGTPMPPKKVRMAPDIKDRLVRGRLASEPALAAKCSKDPSLLRRVGEEVVDRHAPPSTS